MKSAIKSKKVKQTEPNIEEQTPIQEEIKQPIIKVKPKVTYNHHGQEFELFKLDDYLLDNRIGHLDWAEPDLTNWQNGSMPPVQPFGKLISIFVYKPYLDMQGLYDVNSNNIIGSGLSQNRLEKNVFKQSVTIKLAPVPKRENRFNPVTGKNETVWTYVPQDIVINNEFSNVISKLSSQVYSTNQNKAATQSLKNGLTQFKEEFLPPQLSNQEAQAILSGRYTTVNGGVHNMTVFPAIKEAIRRNEEYQNGNIQEFILMTYGDETLYDSLTKEKKVILEKDNLATIPIHYIQGFSWAEGRSVEARENNKGYLVIDDAIILNRKAHLSQVNAKTIISSTESQYGASDETIRRALAAFNKSN